MTKRLTWDDLVPYERQQGGYWDYAGADVYGNGKTWVPVRNPAMVNEPTKEGEPVSENTEPLCDRISRIAEELENSAGDLRGMPGVSRLRAALPDAVAAAALCHIADLVLEQGVELDELRAERDEFRRQRNEWVSDMHAAFAAGLEAPRPATDEQSWQLSQDWIADRVAERQAVRNGGNTL